MSDFAVWLERFHHAAEGSARDALRLEGERLAASRRDFLYQLIQQDPEAALAAAVPRARRAELPAPVQMLLEEPVSGLACFSVQIADDFVRRRREVRREVIIGEQRYEAYVYGARLGQGTRPRAFIWGMAVRTAAGQRLAVHADAVRRLETGEDGTAAAGARCPVSQRPATAGGRAVLAEVGGRIEAFCGARHLELFNQQLTAAASRSAGSAGANPAQLSWSQGPKTCLFMRAVFPEDPTEPISEDQAYALMDGVNQFYVENSYGTTSIVPTVTPLLRLPQVKAWYSVQGTAALLADARSAARAAGFETDNYDWDIVRHGLVPGGNFSWSGLAQVHGKGVWLQSSALSVACHELGHNYGLWHANFWSAVDDSVLGPGSNVEYGNIFDTMSSVGGANFQFNAAFKSQLNWLPGALVQSITESGTYRLSAYDVGSLTPGNTYALKVRKNYGRNYWVEFRQKFTGNPWLQNGALLNWDPWNNGVANSAGGTQLLDTTPGTQTGNNGRDDAAVVVGRTFADPGAGVYFTPVASGVSGTEKWIDISVNLGPFPNNEPPAARLTADRTIAGINIPVHFHVTAVDPDSDALAYAWDFGDDTFGPNTADVTKAWGTAGEYTVRCLVSDMKGGHCHEKLLVTVGTPGTFHAGGRITTPQGLPIEGVRVHNGLTGAAYRGSDSDSDGHYFLPNLPEGSSTIAAVKYGYHFTPVGWTNPLGFGPHRSGLDWVGQADPIVTVEAVLDAAREPPGSVAGRFRISRSGPTNAALAVKFDRSGSALAGIDYAMTPPPTNAPLQLALAPGIASVDILVSPSLDGLAEGPETVTLSLMEDTAYVLGPPAEATLRILDADPAAQPVVDVSTALPGGAAANLAVEGGAGGGAFTFHRSGSVARELVLYYSVGGSATPGLDYEPLAGIVTIPAGERSTTLPLNVYDDDEVEPDETVVVTLLDNPAYAGAGRSDTITILDDDLPTVTITATDATAREANLHSGTFSVTRTGSLAANLLVYYALTGIASNQSDYAALPGTLLIPGGRASATFSVAPINDGLLEGTETVVATLLSTAAYNVGNSGSATVNILDDELPTVTLIATDVTASEAGADSGSFTFSRSGAVDEPLAVFFAVSGTAINGADYAPIDNFIVIPAGASNAVLPILPTPDAPLEIDEKVSLILLPSTTYNVGTAGAPSVTITDAAGRTSAVGFTLASSSGSEANALVRLSVSLSAPSTTTVTVDYAATGGSALDEGADYFLPAGTLTFPIGSVNQTINLFVVNDALVESNETIVVTLSNPTGAILDAQRQHVYTILDDDRSGNLTVAALISNTSERGADPAVFRISRTGGTNTDLSVFFQLTGTASSPSDYQPIPSPAVIPAGASFVDLPVWAMADATKEQAETVILTLLHASDGQIGAPDQAVLVLHDSHDDAVLPTLTVAALDALASEPGTNTAQFVIYRAGPTNEDLLASFTLGGTTTAGLDFLPVGSSAVLSAGATQAVVTVTPREDALFEPDETIVLTLTQLPTYRVGRPASATAILIDNEIGVSVAAVSTAMEAGGEPGRFLITRTGSTASALSVNYAIGGTAGFEDFVPVGNSIQIPAGSDNVTVEVVTTDDLLPEGTETVVLTLTAGAGYTVVSPGNATLSILDDEPAVSVLARDPIAYEGGGKPGFFTITRAGRLDAPLMVHFALNGTAGNGVDYLPLPDSIEIPAGETSVDIAVTPIDDSEVEGNETVQLTLETDAAYAINIPAGALITILDDELNLAPFVAVISPAVDRVFLEGCSNALVLEAEAADDGRPASPGTLTTFWSLASGPAPVIFGNPGALNTTVRFSTNGAYLLRLTATDGQLSASRDLDVVVAPQIVLNAGLEAYWKFDETGGIMAADASGHGREATLLGGGFDAGLFENALHLDGIDDSASFDSMSLTQLTVAAFVRPDSAGNSFAPRVLAMPGYNVQIRRDPAATTNAVAFTSERSVTPGEWRSPGDVVSDGSWSHLAVTYDSTSTNNAPRFFINGTPRATTRRVAPVGAPLANSGPGFIGNSAGMDRAWNGLLEELRLYSRILNPVEVAVLAGGPITNMAPVVDPGPDQTVEFGKPVRLSGSVRDDDHPGPWPRVSHWIRVNGPGSVTFADPDQPATTASFSDAGTYLLRLTAEDGQDKVAGDVEITVRIPTTVIIQAIDSTAAEFGGSASGDSFGWLTLQRTGDLAEPLAVSLALEGSASNGLDYLALSNVVVIPATAATLSLPIVPLQDGLPEGEESVRVIVLPAASYQVGVPSSAMVFIADAPWDQWRFDHFSTADLEQPTISGPEADPDGDGLRNLLEYAFQRDPRSPDLDPGFSATREPLDSLDPGALGFVARFHRLPEPTDLIYQVEVSTDGHAWSGNPEAARELLPRRLDENGATETERVLVLDDRQERRLVRLRVQLRWP